MTPLQEEPVSELGGASTRPGTAGVRGGDPSCLPSPGGKSPTQTPSRALSSPLHPLQPLSVLWDRHNSVHHPGTLGDGTGHEELGDLVLKGLGSALRGRCRLDTAVRGAPGALRG